MKTYILTILLKGSSQRDAKEAIFEFNPGLYEPKDRATEFKKKLQSEHSWLTTDPTHIIILNSIEL